jgi:hypothetical protein
MGVFPGPGYVDSTNGMPAAFYQFFDMGSNVAHMFFVKAILGNQNL